MKIKELIQGIKKLELSADPHSEVKELLNKMGRIGFIQTVLHPGHVIVRARPNEQNLTFSSRADLSYKPQKYNTTYQRASSPNQTMFYGGIVPPDAVNDISGNARFAPAFEASSLIREDEDGIQTLTFSKWVVIKDIPLITICHHEDFVGKHAHTFKLNEAYQKFIHTAPADIAERSLQMTAFLADEFAKKLKTSDPHHHYMISAIFTEISLSQTNAGIYYPSVQTQGIGFNVAIAPEAVDSSLKLVGASECTIYKKGKNMLIDNETIASIDDDAKSFNFHPIEPNYRFGREKSIEKVGL